MEIFDMDNAAVRARIANARLVAEDAQIASDTAGVELFARNKRPAALSGFTSERTFPKLCPGGERISEISFSHSCRVARLR
jgi:hypothetical protein